MENASKLKFADVKKVVAEHLRTALNIEDFTITFAKQEGDQWRVNVEYPEKPGSSWLVSALLSIDAGTGELKQFEKGPVLDILIKNDG